MVLKKKKSRVRWERAQTTVYELAWNSLHTAAAAICRRAPWLRPHLCVSRQLRTETQAWPHCSLVMWAWASRSIPLSPFPLCKWGELQTPLHRRRGADAWRRYSVLTWARGKVTAMVSTRWTSAAGTTMASNPRPGSLLQTPAPRVRCLTSPSKPTSPNVNSW